MISTRGWWFFLVVLLVLVVGLLARHAALTLLGLTLLLWFLAQLLLFAVRVRLVVPRIEVERDISDERGRVDALWAGRIFTVRVRVQSPWPLGLSFATVLDFVPFGLEVQEGETEVDGVVGREPLELSYRVRCPAVGGVRFEGVKVRTADFQGFFYHATFLPGVLTLRSLPVLVDERGRQATAKRTNLLPPPGIHRLRRPGSGSELLDLRDYLPGDPPKTIAWKVSARRDRLITKEFESEVPLRCTVFVDASNSVRIGPPGKNALARLVDIAAGVSQANASSRDLTGLCLFDESTSTIMRPARTSRHLSQLLNVLAAAAGQPPTRGQTPPNQLLPLAYTFAQEVYPYLLRPEVNRVPFWLPWLWPIPGTRRRPLAAGSWILRLLFHLLFGSLLLGLAYGWAWGLEQGGQMMPEFVGVVPPVLFFGLTVLGLVVFYPALSGRALDFLSLVFAPTRRRQARWRKQLAALLAFRHDLGPGGLAMLLEDDEQFSLHLQRFLGEHNVPYSLPLYGDAGRYLFRAEGKVDVLARALLAFVGKGHDNELFVLLVDLLELDDHLEPLLRAVRVALARHHQVIVVCPLPGEQPVRGHKPRTATARLEMILDEATAVRLRGAYQRLRQTFARMGVPVLGAGGAEPVALILARMERLRLAGRRR